MAHSLARALAALLTVITVSSHSLQAANQTWDGGSAVNGNWSTILNWNGDTAAPGATSGSTNADVATFNAAIANTWGNAANNPIVITSGLNIGGLSFTQAAGNYFIGTTGGNAIKLTNGGTIQILSGLTATNAVETVNATLALQGTTYTFANSSANGSGAGAGTLNFGGGIAGTTGTTVLTLSGVNTYIGATTLTAGTLSVGTIGKSTRDIDPASCFDGPPTRMNTHEALRLLDLQAPISRETLNHAYQAAVQCADAQAAGQIYEAYSYLFDIPDHDYPFQPETNSSSTPHEPQYGSPPRHLVVQSEEPAHLEDGPAPFHYRLVAGVIDFLVYSRVAVLCGVNEVYASLNSKAPLGHSTATQHTWIIASSLVFVMLYFVLMESSRWQGTLGKLACRLVVTDLQGQRLSLGRATLRFFATALSILTLGIGLLMALWTRRRQCLHELASQTLLLRKSPSAGLPISVPVVGIGAVGAVVIMLYLRHLDGGSTSLPADAGSPPPNPGFASSPSPAQAPLAKDSQEAQDLLNKGIRYLIGDGVKADSVEAVKWLRQAAELGEPKAQSWLADCLMSGDGTAQDVPQAIQWLRKAAAQSEPFAEYQLGKASQDGQGVPKDEAEALRWYRLSAGHGDSAAQSQLGHAYLDGQFGLAKDPAAAAKWLLAAAEQHRPEAQFTLGYLCEEGLGVAQDATKAVHWYTKAAEQGHAVAQNNLGLCYECGNGVPKDIALAVQWYTKSAAQGDPFAQTNLGSCYASGKGFAQDAALAVQWYTKAAVQGNVDAQVALSACYEQGAGIKQDLVEATKWLHLAAAQSDARAIEHLKSIAVSLTPEQTIQARLLAEEFQKARVQ